MRILPLQNNLLKGAIEHMPNYKEHSRYNVVSLRVSDEEKAVLDEVSRRTRKSLSSVVREAIQLYSREVTMLSSAGRNEIV